MLELDAGIRGGEAPIDGAAGGVAVSLPGGDFALQCGPVGEATVQALLRQHAQLDLRHIQPAPILGGGGDSSLSASRLASAGGNASYSDAGVWVLGVVLHQHDLLGVGVADVDQLLDGSAPSRCGCAAR